MSETTPLIKAALNLRVGVGFDVYEQTAVEMDRVDNRELLLFCKTPRTRKEISDYLGLNSVTYAIQTRVMPLVERGIIKMSIPEKPKSPKQLFYCD